MPKPKKEVTYKTLDTKAMRVAGNEIYVGGARFKRVVLPSAATPKPKPIELEAERLMDELDAEQDQ